jgi:hypothetical protein
MPAWIPGRPFGAIAITYNKEYHLFDGRILLVLVEAIRGGCYYVAVLHLVTVSSFRAGTLWRFQRFLV